MSHKETVIEPGEGITALVGPNNCGKSAVLVGLETVCRRLQGDFMVAHGAKEASVTVETDDGHVVAWSRKGKKARFTIDGEDFDRPRDPVVLKRVNEVLRLPKVGSSETELHFGKQKEPVFDAIAKPRQAAELLAAASDVAYLLQMQSLHKSRQLASKHDKDRCQSELDRHEKLGKVLGPILSFEKPLRKVQEQWDGITRRQEQIEALKNHLTEFNELKQKQARLTKESSLYRKLKSPPKLADTDSLCAVLGELQDTNKAVVELAKKQALIKKLPQPPELEDSENLRKLCTDLAEEQKNNTRLTDNRKKLESRIKKEAKAIRDWAVLAKECPTCGQELDPDKVLETIDHAH